MMDCQRAINQKGFTLIEIIVTLILVAILAAVGSVGLVNMVQGYVTARSNAEALQKGQAAMLQITKLLTFTKTVNNGATASSITFVTHDVKHPTNTTTYTLNFSNGVVTLGDDILINQVQQFRLGYYDHYNATEQSTWSASSKLIEVTMRLNLEQGGTSPEFKTRIIPRNVIYSSP